jgi:hypothetical protein
MVLSTTLVMCQFCLSGSLERAPSKGQGVSIQRLSSNLFNMNERSKAQGAGKGDLFQLTTDEPHDGELGSSGWEDSSKIIGETLQS